MNYLRRLFKHLNQLNEVSDFYRCYTNAADDNLVKDMLEWFESDDEAKTVTANRDTRKIYKSGWKWAPLCIIELSKSREKL